MLSQSCTIEQLRTSAFDSSAGIWKRNLLASNSSPRRHMLLNSSPNRDPGSKWYVSLEQWPGSVYPPYMAGPGQEELKDSRFHMLEGFHVICLLEK